MEQTRLVLCHATLRFEESQRIDRRIEIIGIRTDSLGGPLDALLDRTPGEWYCRARGGLGDTPDLAICTPSRFYSGSFRQIQQVVGWWACGAACFRWGATGWRALCATPYLLGFPSQRTPHERE
jgi:hypothetical protein